MSWNKVLLVLSAELLLTTSDGPHYGSRSRLQLTWELVRSCCNTLDVVGGARRGILQPIKRRMRSFVLLVRSMGPAGGSGAGRHLAGADRRRQLGAGLPRPPARRRPGGAAPASYCTTLLLCILGCRRVRLTGHDCPRMCCAAAPYACAACVTKVIVAAALCAAAMSSCTVRRWL